jgi:hypothetical protein
MTEQACLFYENDRNIYVRDEMRLRRNPRMARIIFGV